MRRAPKQLRMSVAVNHVRNYSSIHEGNRKTLDPISARTSEEFSIDALFSGELIRQWAVIS